MPLVRTRKRKLPYSVEELVERLESVYGKPRLIARFDPMEELVSCILSQHTADANSFPAFTRMRAYYPDWAAIEEVSVEQLADVIRKAGLANQKARNIQACLRQIRERVGEYSLEPVRSMPLLEGRRWLMDLPGVGPKTASIVQCFAFGLGAIPVDTHVFRVSGRLGLIDAKTDETKAHDALLGLVPASLAFRFHVSLIQHGRQTCKAPVPECGTCVVQSLCPWFKKVGPEKLKAVMAAKRKSAAVQRKGGKA